MVNEFVKRVRAALTHARIMAHLRKQMPVMTGFAEKQKKLLENLEGEFEKCVHEYQLPRGDLPNPKRFREIVSGMQIWKFPKVGLYKYLFAPAWGLYKLNSVDTHSA